MNRNRQHALRWIELEKRIKNKEKHESFLRLLPIVSAARSETTLQKLFPFTSHEILCLSINDRTYPSSDFPCVAAIPRMTHATALRMMQQDSKKPGITLEDITIMIQAVFNQYDFLFKLKQPNFELNDKNKITHIHDLFAGIDWIFESSYGMFLNYKNTKAAMDETPFEIRNTSDTIDYLVESIKNNPLDYTSSLTKH